MKRSDALFIAAMLGIAVAMSNADVAGAQFRIVSPTTQGTVQAAWLMRVTDHFDIYYRRQQPGNLIDEIAREAERAYLRVSMDLDHELEARVPLILVEQVRELPQNGLEASHIIRASGAPDRDHVLLSLEPLDGRAAILAHEITHQFEFEMIPSSSLIPPWVHEGLSEHEAGAWTTTDLSILRDAAAAGRISPVAGLTTSDRLWGHAVFDFVAAEYGSQGIRRYLSALRGRSTAGDDSTRAAFGIEARAFDGAFLRKGKVQRTLRPEGSGLVLPASRAPGTPLYA